MMLERRTNYFVLVTGVLLFVINLWIFSVSAEITKRAAILSPSSSLDSDNDIDSLFVTKRIKFPGRTGRTLTNETTSGSSSSSSSGGVTNVETSRKASPDVQDIIDGIVKLLGGKVHPANSNQQQQQQQPLPPPPPPQQIPSYNLFNPQKPVGKPSRINNRGPPFIDPRPPQPPVPQPLDVNRGPPLNENNHMNNNNDGPYHDRRPLYDMNRVPPQNHHNRGQMQQQQQQQQHQQQMNEYRPVMFENNNNNNNRDRAPIIKFQDSRPSSSAENSRPTNAFEAIPLEALNGFNNNLNKTRLGPPFPLPTLGSYKPVAEAPYRKGIPLPLQIVPTKFGPSGGGNSDSNGDDEDDNNGNSGVNNWPKVPGPPTMPPLIAEEPKITNSNNNNKSDKSSSNKKTTSLLVPVSTPTTPPPPPPKPSPQIIEDDEADEDSLPIKLEPTIKDSSSLIMDIQPSTVNSIQTSFSTATSTTGSSISSDTAFDTVQSSPPTTTAASVQVRPTSVPELHGHVETPVMTSLTFNNNNYESSSAITALSSTPTPPLRPGIVINEAPPHSSKPVGGGNQGFGSVEVVTAEGHGGVGQVGEIFDVTVTAKQHYGAQATGQPFIIPVDLKDELITQPNGDHQFVSIDGKRQYFNLHPNTAAVVGSVTQTSSGSAAVISSNNNNNKHTSLVQSPIPIRPVTTTLTISPNPNSPSSSSSSSSSGSVNTKIIPKTPPNIVRRPMTRKPAIPPVRIDTCIVGDDSTCNSEQFEICKTESGVSSCLCRAGYARRRHREPCKAIVSMVLSIKLDKLGDKKLNYNPEYFNPNSEIYQTLEWETIHAMDSAMVDTTLHSSYVGAKLDAIGFDGRHAVVNSTVLLQENPKMSNNQVKREIQRQLIQSLTRSRNNFGKSQLWVEGPISAIAAVGDVDECQNPDLNDCDTNAKCLNTFGSFECKCEAGYGDPHENNKRLGGRKCETCNGKTHCNGRGECSIEKGQKVCKCSGNYYGSQCDIDGEVLAVAIGASVSAVVIIGLTLACLCMWSRRWKREEQKAAIMSRTLFGGMASQALSYLSKNTMNSSNPYQQHVTLDDRLRWAQVADTNLNGNIYVQNEPMSMMDSRRSAETIDTTVDDIFDMDRHQTKRPRSRSSQMQNGGIYYDLEPQSEMYASSPPIPYPAQFCVPMNPYHRSFYN